jgi:hypothetical protein
MNFLAGLFLVSTKITRELNDALKKCKIGPRNIKANRLTAGTARALLQGYAMAHFAKTLIAQNKM